MQREFCLCWDFYCSCCFWLVITELLAFILLHMLSKWSDDYWDLFQLLYQFTCFTRLTFLFLYKHLDTKNLSRISHKSLRHINYVLGVGTVFICHTADKEAHTQCNEFFSETFLFMCCPVTDSPFYFAYSQVVVSNKWVWGRMFEIERNSSWPYSSMTTETMDIWCLQVLSLKWISNGDEG